MVLEMEPGALGTLGKCCTTELYLSPTGPLCQAPSVQSSLALQKSSLCLELASGVPETRARTRRLTWDSSLGSIKESKNREPLEGEALGWLLLWTHWGRPYRAHSEESHTMHLTVIPPKGHLPLHHPSGGHCQRRVPSLTL